MKYVITCLLLFIAPLLKAQQMSLDSLTAYLGQTVFKSVESLKSGGWRLHPELSAEQNNQLYKTFAFGASTEGTQKAVSWFRIHADNQIVNQLYYQLPGKEELDTLVAEIMKKGAQKKGVAEIQNGQLTSFYIGFDFVFQTIIAKDSYTLMVAKKPRPDQS